MAKSVKSFLTIYNSRRDFAGNCYWAFQWVRVRDGKTIGATISGGESNISAIVREMGMDWEEVRTQRVELPIREFNRVCRPWPYAGCCPCDLAAWLKAQLRKRVKN